MKKIQDADLENKKVLARVDFNVGISDGKIQEKFKLEACQETVDFILSQEGTKLAVCSHLGRPNGKVNPEFSLSQIRETLEEILGRRVVFVDDCIGEKVNEAMINLAANEILLLENVRFYEGEEENEDDFAEKLAANFDVFVNEAFSVCHRDQASVTGVTKFLPGFAGFWLQKEIENLNNVFSQPAHPAVAIIGGAKIETKLPLIQKFENSYEAVLVGGMIANEAIEQKISFSEKVFLPVDFADEQRRDIGEKTIEKFKEIISGAKTVIWNGPLGKFEESPFDKSTRIILDAVMESGAFSLIGGGESVQVLEENGLIGKISFVSTGGGAMLEYLSGNKMPGIEALIK
ncbi:MAG: Phosphoglycerate kinase [uncultured bacterium]|nr:MAG: Phosphoglycerate kinase [uncultured bacterium]